MNPKTTNFLTIAFWFLAFIGAFCFIMGGIFLINDLFVDFALFVSSNWVLALAFISPEFCFLIFVISLIGRVN